MVKVFPIYNQGWTCTCILTSTYSWLKERVSHFWFSPKEFFLMYLCRWYWYIHMIQKTFKKWFSFKYMIFIYILIQWIWTACCWFARSELQRLSPACHCITGWQAARVWQQNSNTSSTALQKQVLHCSQKLPEVDEPSVARSLADSRSGLQNFQTSGICEGEWMNFFKR